MSTKRREAPAPKKRRNLLNSLGIEKVDCKDTTTLRQFISERGKIRSRTVTGVTVQQQRQVPSTWPDDTEQLQVLQG